MPIVFYIADSISEALVSDSYIIMDEEIDSFIYENKEVVLPHGNLLIDLDPYDHREFSEKEIYDLISICKLLSTTFDVEEIKKFAKDLVGLCEKAIIKNKLIVALGD